MRYLLFLSLACTSQKGADTGQIDLDADGDGYNVLADCDDDDALVAPGEVEDPYDGLDNDCNPETLDDDLDEDGALSSVDCDDGDDAIRPGADELCNGQDDDCDGEADEGAAASDIEEECGNGFDDDCDGSADECRFDGESSIEDADAWFLGELDDDHANISGPLSDLDGDGAEDVVVTMCGVPLTCTGITRVFSGPLSGPLKAEDASTTIYGDEDNAYAWLTVSGDLFGEGAADLALARYRSAPGKPVIDVFRGPIFGDVSQQDADLQLMVEGSFDGDAVHPLALQVADLSDDGAEDLLVHLGYVSDYSGVAVLTIHFGPLSDGDVSTEDADVTLSSDFVQTTSPDALALDLDGDGVDDVALSEPDAEDYAGAIYVELGPLESGSIQDADQQVVGDEEDAFLGVDLADAGDADGDGLSDLWAIALAGDTNGSDAGAAYLLLGSSEGLSTTALATISGQDGLGLSSATSDDLDGDAQPDLLLGDYCPYGAPGTVSLFFGPVSGSTTVAHADASFVGGATEDCFGSLGRLFVAEINGDGMPDLAAAAQGIDQGAGGAFFFYGLSL